MKALLNPQKLPRLTLVLGMAGLVLQNLLFAIATDRKGLLASHPLGLLLGAVTVAALVLILAGVLRWQQEPLVPLRPNTWDVVTLITTLGFLPVLFRDGFAPSRLILVRNVLAILVILSFLALFLLRRRDKQPHFALYAIPCLFFAVHLVSCYQTWSSNPQILDYLFTLLANVGLMLYFYYKTAALVGFCKEKRMLTIGLLTVFFCFTSISVKDFSLLHLCCGSWILTDLRAAFSGE